MWPYADVMGHQRWSKQKDLKLEGTFIFVTFKAVVHCTALVWHLSILLEFFQLDFYQSVLIPVLLQHLFTIACDKVRASVYGHCRFCLQNIFEMIQALGGLFLIFSMGIVLGIATPHLL